LLKTPHALVAGVGIKDPPMLKIDTRETVNPDKAISFDQKGASIHSLQLSGHSHKMAESGFSSHP
jgi:hypothetical protein